MLREGTIVKGRTARLALAAVIAGCGIRAGLPVVRVRLAEGPNTYVEVTA